MLIVSLLGRLSPHIRAHHQIIDIEKEKEYNYGIHFAEKFSVPFKWQWVNVYSLRNKPITFEIFGDYWELSVLTDIAKEINNELELCAIFFVPTGRESVCERDGVDEFCVVKEVKASYPGSDVLGASLRHGPEDFFAEFEESPLLRHKSGKIFTFKWLPILESDVLVEKFPIPEKNHSYYSNRKTSYIIKHELLHSLGFAHYPGGVMEPSGFNIDKTIHTQQLEHWQNMIKKTGGFHEDEESGFWPNCNY